jgi:hemerythrin-like domain-containing protein
MARAIPLREEAGMNAIEMLKEQHREAKQLMQRLNAAPDDEQRMVFLDLADALTVHAIIEERHFYPAVLERRTEDIVETSLTEHVQMKSLIESLVDTEVGTKEWVKLVDALRTEVVRHFDEEEQQLFPKVEQIFGVAELDEIGVQMESTAAELESEGAPHEQLGVEVERPIV